MASRARVAVLTAVLSLAAALALAAPAPALEPLAQIGTSGSGAGQLDFPSGVVTDAAGRLFVGDAGNSRVSQFTPRGGFARAFGWDVIPAGGTGFEVCTVASGCKVGIGGGGAGQLNLPRGVATDAAGRLFVGDVNNNRVSQFTTQGGFVRAFGFDVIPGGGTGFEMCTAATDCKGGVQGGGPGQFTLPRGVATDPAGRLHVADGNNRVSQFTPQGGFVRSFGFDVIPGGGTGFEVCTTATGCKAGVFGGGAGQLTFPSGLATDPAGRLFVADTDNNRVSQFTPQGGFVRSFGFDVVPGGGTGFEVCTIATDCKAGVAGSGAGQLNFPFGVATDAAGRIFVADSNNNRVSQFTPQGGFARAFGSDVIPGGGTGFEVCTVATGCKAGVSGGGAGQLDTPLGVATDCRGAVYVSEQFGDRVQRFGEAGTPPPPCPGPNPPRPPTPVDPSNEFSFGKAKKNKRKGTAKLTVIVPGPGELDLAKTKKVKPDDESAEGQGEEKLAIKPKSKSKRKLRRKGKAKVKAEVTYTPNGGEPNTESKRIKLIRK